MSATAGTATGSAPAPNTFSNSGERIGESAGQTSGLATSASMNETGGACVALGRSSKLELRLWLSFFHGRWLRQQQSIVRPRTLIAIISTPIAIIGTPIAIIRTLIAIIRTLIAIIGIARPHWCWRVSGALSPVVALCVVCGRHAHRGWVARIACAHVRYEVIGIWPLPRCG